MLKEFTIDQTPLSLNSLLINLVIGLLVSILIKIHYRKFGSTITNREEFSNIFPFILLTTILIITVVKSSLALSLGLVGALSIVRFRTPIKEPEELAYLFICIAAGLGFGANQTVLTLISILFILISVSVIRFKSRDKVEKNMYLTIELSETKNIEKNEISKKINSILSAELKNFDLRQLDVKDNFFQATYIIAIDDVTMLENSIVKLNKSFPKISINYIDQNQVPSI
mgnify:FL=1|tara:strand:+ start:91 stop:774 length:684 start_codon:yes stop_codon:yes gene_type:complete